jgi:hypothetical protein
VRARLCVRILIRSVEFVTHPGHVRHRSSSVSVVRVVAPCRVLGIILVITNRTRKIKVYKESTKNVTRGGGRGDPGALRAEKRKGLREAKGARARRAPGSGHAPRLSPRRPASRRGLGSLCCASTVKAADSVEIIKQPHGSRPRARLLVPYTSTGYGTRVGHDPECARSAHSKSKSHSS